MKLKNKVIVVTGAGSGIGRALTLQLVKKGAKVVMIDIREESLLETTKMTDSKMVSSHVLDISNRNEVEKFVEEFHIESQKIDGIINNAGIIQPFIDVHELTYEKIERIMNINFYGTLYMTKSLLPYLLKRPEAFVTTISSMGGFIPFPGQTFYGASKAAVKLLTEGLYAELKKTNVHVSVVFPGAVNTHIMSNSGVQSIDQEKQSEKAQEAMAISPQKAASIILAGIEKNKFRILVGKDARLLDFMYRLYPKFAVNFITKQMSKLKL